MYISIYIDTHVVKLYPFTKQSLSVLHTQHRPKSIPLSHAYDIAYHYHTTFFILRRKKN